MEKTENTDPHIERLINQYPVFNQNGAQVKQQKTDREESVYKGNQMAKADISYRNGI